MGWWSDILDETIRWLEGRVGGREKGIGSVSGKTLWPAWKVQVYIRKQRESQGDWSLVSEAENGRKWAWRWARSSGPWKQPLNDFGFTLGSVERYCQGLSWRWLSISALGDIILGLSRVGDWRREGSASWSRRNSQEADAVAHVGIKIACSGLGRVDGSAKGAEGQNSISN